MNDYLKHLSGKRNYKKTGLANASVEQLKAITTQRVEENKVNKFSFFFSLLNYLI
jgi:hypothetical protein